ncbi:uncharacterized protein N7506_007148 [Penicillium brevicompactum]|uniref:uncharacterized protein n=1 Tax=Penicillium brevicompactum TaxID=5074 RepID=UPI002540533E|nr:uncharacterized protein N7506_007148 [Penicillium brevicompactum]KAJ5333365.1 hypothetical protein N7506_007148 [Penicillium brevicompactum]
MAKLLPAMSSSTAAVASATPFQEEALEKPVQSSKAWIAGAVLGPVLGVLAAGIVFWCLQRRQTKAAQFNQPGPFLAGMSSRRQDFSPAQEMDSVAYPRVHELSSYK